ncbi:MAG: glutathione peroxidase [Bdellovibrionales bacterium]|nr:glutathione peroxidase [Bdellovibrionales bacterium]
MPQFFDLEAKLLSGKPYPFENLRGKTSLIVNVASFCGFTPQYDGLQKLYEDYQSKGLVVLGFPCNQFGEQEPGDEKAIQSFCDTRFKLTFPLMSKVDVNGPNTHPVYEFLKSEKKGFLGSQAIKWNFTKFLVDKDGNVLKRYAPTDTPEKIAKDLEKILN